MNFQTLLCASEGMQGKNYDLKQVFALTQSMLCHTQAFFDTGSGLNEEQSSHFYHPYIEDFSLCIPVVKGSSFCPIYPADDYVIVVIKKCYGVSKEEIASLSYVPGDAVLFDTTDPQIYFFRLTGRYIGTSNYIKCC